MTSWKRQSYDDSRKISRCQGLRGKGGMKRQSPEVVYGSEATLCNTVELDTGHYKFVQTCKIHKAENEP